MPTAGSPSRTRSRRSVDPRLLIGLGLVLASVAGVVGVVSAADASTAVYAAPEPLAVGDRITAADLVQRHVVLDGAERRYLSPAELPADGAIVIRSVDAGELVPISAVGEPEGERQTTVVVELPAEPSAAIRPGAGVEIWGARASAGSRTSTGGSEPSPPAVLVAGATVVRLLEGDDMLSSSSGVSVELLVPRSRVARLLQAMADDESISLVPDGLPIGAGS